MLSSLIRLASVRLLGAILFAGLFVVLSAATSPAQSGPGVDNSKGLPDNKIEGRIHFPGPAPVAPIRIRLSGDRGETSTNTDRDGRFYFNWIRPGRYTLTVDGGTMYQSVSQTVDVIPLPSVSMQGDRPSQTATVSIRLQLKASTESAGVTNVSFANIPKPAVELYEQALKAAQEGDRKKAIDLLKNCLSIHPQFVEALNGLGVQYMKLGEFEKAAEAFSSALKIEPDLFILHLNYGVVLFQLKKYAEAEAELALASKKNEASPTAHFIRGRALIGLQRYGEAESEFQRVITLGGEEVSQAHRYLGGIYVEKGDHKSAVGELEAYLKLTPKAKDADKVREMIKQLRTQQ